jgi:hypothetical protein
MQVFANCKYGIMLKEILLFCSWFSFKMDLRHIQKNYIKTKENKMSSLTANILVNMGIIGFGVLICGIGAAAGNTGGGAGKGAISAGLAVAIVGLGRMAYFIIGTVFEYLS